MSDEEKEAIEILKLYFGDNLTLNITKYVNIVLNLIEKQSKEIEELKEKNKKIDEFCRKELAFERRLKREDREPDEFNQGRFYVSENIRKIIEEE